MDYPVQDHSIKIKILYLLSYLIYAYLLVNSVDECLGLIKVSITKQSNCNWSFVCTQQQNNMSGNS